jgi:hypothetical protein
MAAFLERGWIAMLLVGAPEPASAQQPVVAVGQFAPAANVILFTDFSQDAIGGFPSYLTYKSGPLDVVQVNGVNMLRSTGPGEFLIPLPGRLPADFTLEFELIARGSTCCAGDELTFEGGPARDESSGSAHIIFNQSRSDIRGGGITGAAVGVQFPDALQNEFPGQLVTIQAQFTGPAFKYFVNGRLIRNIPQLLFRRTTVIRVSLGGVNDAREAVYLKSIRLATGRPMALASTGTSPGAPTPPPGQPQPPAPPGQPPSPVPPPPPTAPSTTAPVPNQPSSTGGASTPGATAGPVSTVTSGVRNAARCIPAATAGPTPQGFLTFGIRVGGAPLRWYSEPNTAYVLERSDLNNPSAAWTTIATSCGTGLPMLPGQFLDESSVVPYPTLNVADDVPGVQMGGQYLYRLTAIQLGGAAGSTLFQWDAPTGGFQAAPAVAVNGHDVTITTDVSICLPHNIRCDPTRIDYVVKQSSTGWAYSSRQNWVDNSDPLGMPATFAFTISGVPSGTHTIQVTAIYPPDFAVVAGIVTVVVP